MVKGNLKKHVDNASDHLEAIELIQDQAESVSAFQVAKKMELAEQAVKRSVEFSRAIVAALREIQEA
jgi:predicted DNA-binding protein (UPF0251 family)